MDLTLLERFALIGLNGKESEHWSIAKHVVLKALAAAEYLISCYDDMNKTLRIDESKLQDVVKKTSKKELERKIYAGLESKNLIAKVNSLLGCDLFYDKNIRLKVYVSDSREFEYQIDYLRAEFLEDGPVTDEGLLMVWLLREAQCLSEVFSYNEQNKISTRMSELSEQNKIAKTLYPIKIKSTIEAMINGYLRLKSEFAATNIGKGINFIFPFLEREQSVFIDTEEYFPNAKMRLENVLARISEQGHTYEVLRTGSVPVVKIDNIKYELLPGAMGSEIPVHGVRLRRYN